MFSLNSRKRIRDVNEFLRDSVGSANESETAQNINECKEREMERHMKTYLREI